MHEPLGWKAPYDYKNSHRAPTPIPRNRNASDNPRQPPMRLKNLDPMLLRALANPAPANPILERTIQLAPDTLQNIPDVPLEIGAEDLLLALFRSPQPQRFLRLFGDQDSVVEEAAEVHFGDVGVQEEGADGVGGVIDSGGEGVVAWVELHDGAAFELAVFGVVADGADVCLYSVVWEAEHHGCGEEGFFVAFARGALAQDGVVEAGAVDVVVGCEE